MTVDVQPETGPWVWKGSEMAGRDDWVRPFDEEAITEIEAAVAHARATGKPLPELTRGDFPLPGLATTLESWLRELDEGRGFLLARGLPVERWGDDDAALAYFGLGLHLGTPISQNAAGDVLGHVRDTGADPDDPSVRRYRTREGLGFHVDGADLIGLLCLRTARSGGASRITSSGAVFNEVLTRRPDLAPLLFQRFHFDRNEEQAPGEPPTFQLPICRHEGGRLRTFYIGWYIRDAQRHAEVPRLTPEQHELLDLIDAITEEPSVHLGMDFRPGDVQLLKNSVMLHARSHYEDHDEPEKKRHLLRLWLTARGFEDEFVNQGIPRKAGVASDAELARS